MTPTVQARQLFEQATVACRAGDVTRGVDLFRRAIRSDAGNPILHTHSASALMSFGAVEPAHDVLAAAIKRFPTHAAILNDLAGVLFTMGRPDEAVLHWQRAITHAPPTFTAPLFNLASVLQKLDRPDEAEALLRRALSSDSNNAGAWHALGNIRRDLGDIVDAIACFDRAIAARPDYASAHHARLFAMLFHDALSWRQIVEQHVRWAERFADPLTVGAAPHAHDRTSAVTRRLRIGYIGPMFTGHVISRLLEPVFAKHDRSQFEIFVYCNAPAASSHREALAPHCGQWRQCERMTDDDLARGIRSDAIDILVDVNGHMASSRLLAMARKPAPIQINWLSYPATYGMKAFDYRVSCAGLDPVGAVEPMEPERLIRLPHTFWCYPSNEDAPADLEVPSRRNGYVTFGCLNAFSKVRDACAETWSRVLAAVPQSRLMILVQGGEGGRSVLKRFERFGIDPARVIVNGYVPREAHLARFNTIDVFLDSFPYGGHVTTHDALWMGLPVIAMRGQTPVSRAGETILSHVGLSDLVASDREEYVKLAVEMANDEPRRIGLRASLRPRMKASPLTDAAQFTRALEKGYRAAWERFIEGAPAADITV